MADSGQGARCNALIPDGQVRGPMSEEDEELEDDEGDDEDGWGDEEPEEN